MTCVLFVKWIKFSVKKDKTSKKKKNTGKMGKKILSRNFVSSEKWEPCYGTITREEVVSDQTRGTRAW